MRGSVVRRLRHWIANRGWKGFFLEVIYQVRKRLRPAGAGTAVTSGQETITPAPRPELHPFDERYGVETGGLIWGEDLPGGSKGDYWSTGYYGIAPSIFRQMLGRLDLDWARYTFVDVGCGKGRALMLALQYPFRKVLGIELSPELVAVANRNLSRFQADWRQESPAEAIAGDATLLELPEGPLVIYLYHPFAAPVMVQFLKRLRASLAQSPRSVYLLYVNPELDSLLVRTPQLSKLWRECFPMEDDEVIADHFGSKQEYVAAYAAE